MRASVSPPAVPTLLDALDWQTVQRGHAVALRHKQLGIWQETSWQQLATEVARLAAALAARGVQAGDRLALLSQQRPQALTLALAAQWLGAEAVPLAPQQDAATLLRLLQALAPVAVLAEAQAEVDQVLAALPDLALLVYADGHGLAGYRQPALLSYPALLAMASGGDVPRQAEPDRVAFRFVRLDDDGHLQQQSLTHRHLLAEGAHLLAVEQLGADDVAFAARAFATTAQVRYLLSPWLQAGFSLNFPENLATRDTDRRELGPTLVAGTRETYGRLAAQVRARLPQAGGWQDALVQWARVHPVPRWRRAIGYWLVRRPLLDVLGLRHTRAPLLAGPPLSADDARFFEWLGITVRVWPDPAEWHRADPLAANLVVPRHHATLLLPGSLATGSTP